LLLSNSTRYLQLLVLFVAPLYVRISQQQLETARKHEEEVRDLMNHDKKKLEAEIQKLREQVVQALGQVSHEKDRCAAKILAERATSERTLQDVQNESLKTQSQLQAQLAKRLQDAQVLAVRLGWGLQMFVVFYDRMNFSNG
jgi:multidrug resistance efflux pump